MSERDLPAEEPPGRVWPSDGTKRKRGLGESLRRIGGEILEHPGNRGHRVRAVARSVGWQVRKRVIRRPYDIDYEGLTLRCYPDSGSASNVFYFGPRYEYHEMTFLDRYLRPGDNFLDIGANIGTHSLFVAARTGAAARIEAFEPLPVAAERCRENFALNGLQNALVHQVAVGRDPGPVQFLSFDVSSSIDHDTLRKGKILEVQVARIDDTVQGQGFAAAKIDVEGFEQQALEGARRLLDRADPPVWILEVLDHQLEKHGSSADQLVAYMAERGYSAGWYDADTGLLSFDPDGWREHPNAIFVADANRAAVLARLSG